MSFHTFDQAFSQNLKVLQNRLHIGNADQLVVQSCHLPSFHAGDLQDTEDTAWMGAPAQSRIATSASPQVSEVPLLPCHIQTLIHHCTQFHKFHFSTLSVLIFRANKVQKWLLQLLLGFTLEPQFKDCKEVRKQSNGQEHGRMTSVQMHSRAWVKREQGVCKRDHSTRWVRVASALLFGGCQDLRWEDILGSNSGKNKTLVFNPARLSSDVSISSSTLWITGFHNSSQAEWPMPSGREERRINHPETDSRRAQAASSEPWVTGFFASFLHRKQHESLQRASHLA